MFAALTLGTGSPASAKGLPLFLQTGYTSEEMGAIKPEFQAQLAGMGGDIKAGYVYQRIGVFWINIWTWGGEFALFRNSGSTIEYEALAKEELAAMIGVDPATIKPPLSYRIPFLFRLIGYAAALGGAFLALGAVLMVVDKRKLAKLKSDPTYQRAFEQLEKRLGPPEETKRLPPKRIKKAIAEGADYLEKHDIPRAEAEKNLDLFTRETYKDADRSESVESPAAAEDEPPTEERPRKKRPQSTPRNNEEKMDFDLD
jgi:hypothetical protein